MTPSTLALLAAIALAGNETAPEASGGKHRQGHRTHGVPATRVPKVAMGKRAIGLSAQNLAGKTLSLTELQQGTGEKKLPVVLTFWCSFCGSCRHVEHDVDKLAGDYAGRAAVYAIDASGGETAEKVKAFAKKEGLTMPILLDPKGAAADLFGVTLTTTTIVLDREGRVVYVGRFSQGRHHYAQDALEGVLAGTGVKVSNTKPEG